MTDTTTDKPAVDRLGTPVPTPDGVDTGAWRRFCRNVVMIPDGCHLWLSPPRSDGYGQFWALPNAIRSGEDGAAPLFDDGPDPTETEAPAKVWRAHRFAWVALTGDDLTEVDHLMHQCDEPMCVPITRVQLAGHLARGDNDANVSERERRGRGVRRGFHGLTGVSRADTRGQVEHSRALHRALNRAIAEGAAREDLPAVIRAVAVDGDPFAHQPTLWET